MASLASLLSLLPHEADSSERSPQSSSRSQVQEIGIQRPLAQENWLGGQVRAGGKVGGAGVSTTQSLVSCPPLPHHLLLLCLPCLRCYSLVSQITLVPDSISQGISGFKRLRPHFSSSSSPELHPVNPTLLGCPSWQGTKDPTPCPGPLPSALGTQALFLPSLSFSVSSDSACHPPCPNPAPEQVALDSSSLFPQSLSPSQSQRLGMHRLFSHLNRSEGQVC